MHLHLICEKELYKYKTNARNERRRVVNGKNCNKMEMLWTAVDAGFCTLPFWRITEVSADSTTCRVIFANSKGNYSSGSYRKWTRSVKTGTTVELPKVTRKGYEVRWSYRDQWKTAQVFTGTIPLRSDRIQNFCLKLYKLYTVSFYTANGKKEYKNLRQTVVAGGRIKMPVGSSNTTYQFRGWSTKQAGAVQYKSGASVRVRKVI